MIEEYYVWRKYRVSLRKAETNADTAQLHALV